MRPPLFTILAFVTAAILPNRLTPFRASLAPQAHGATAWALFVVPFSLPTFCALVICLRAFSAIALSAIPFAALPIECVKRL